jgi:hypothetical protein
MTIYTGSCHCGALKFSFEGEITQAIDCNCSICRKKGHLLAFGPRSALTIEAGENIAQIYRFNSGNIAHTFCPTCGVGPYGIGENNGQPMAAVNVRCLDGLDLEALKLIAFDGASR